MSIQIEDELQKVSFIAKVTSLGKDRLIIAVPSKNFKETKSLKGKHVKVFLEEVTLEDA